MRKRISKHPEHGRQKPVGGTDKKTKEFPGYPLYPADEDMYFRSVEEWDLNPEDPSSIKSPNLKVGLPNEQTFNDGSGDDLDVPGSELDDEQEATGNEDEENNYYSLGGDDHNDLEENGS